MRQDTDAGRRADALRLTVRDAMRELRALTEGTLAARAAPESAVVPSVDDTPRHAAEEALHESETRLRAIVDNIPECVKLVSRDGRLLDMNAAGLRLIEADHLAEVLGRPVVEFIHPDDRAAFMALHRRVVAGGDGEVRFRVIGLRGTERWMETRSAPLRAGDGTVGSVLSITRDISEHLQSEGDRHSLLIHEQAARRQADDASRYYRTLFESAPGCFLVLTPDDFVITTVSEAFLRVIGTTRERITGRRLFEGLLQRGTTPVAQAVQNLRASLERVKATLQTDVMTVQRYPIPRRRGVVGGALEERFWSPVNSPVPGPDGALAYIICRVEDVTEFIRFKQRSGEGDAAIVALDTRAEQLEADIVLRGLELRRANEVQAQNQAILRIAGRIARLGGWVVSVPDRALTLSDETAAIHDEPAGFAPTLEEAIQYYLPEYREAVAQAFEACLRQGTGFDYEAQIGTARGRRVWVRAIGEAVRGASGEITHVQGAMQDISDQKTAADQIRSLGYRLVDTLETISDAFFTLDREWRFTFLNAEAERLLEGARADLIGRSAWDRFTPEVGGAFEREYRRVMTEGVAARFEEFYSPLQRWFEVDAYPSREGLTVYFRDVTERNRSREVQRELDARLREQATLLDKANDAIMVRDLDHRVLYWNRSAEQLYGWCAAEALGRTTQDLLHADSATFTAAMVTTLARGEWLGEIEHQTRDGRTLIIEGHWTLVRDEGGEPRSVLSINTDITQRKKLEAQFLRAQRMESIGALAGGIAHDLNNALAPILMTVSLLQDDERDPTRREDLATIESCARRGADMVRQLLSFARGSDGRRSRVDLAAIAAEIQNIVRDTFPKDISFRLSTARDLWEVDGDATQMHQMLTNLCVNARDAMPHGGTLTVAIEHLVLDEIYAGMNLEARPGPYVVIRVEDTGTGMPPKVLEQIFEPFFTTKDVGKGTGLGLSTVHAIVRNHGGFVRVYTEVGRGTQFKVYLPAAVSTAASAETVVAQTKLPLGHGELVLVVDDEEAIRQVTRRTLERFGYRVLLAGNGAEAVAQYAVHRGEIAVVLTDMSMPVMDGPATIVALRAIDPRVRIIGSSGFSAHGHVAKAVGAGVRHFVPKPYTAEVLLDILRTILTEPT